MRKLFQIPGDSYVSSLGVSLRGRRAGSCFSAARWNVRRAYRAAGLKLQAERRFPDDHIAAMMEYLAYMGTRAYDCFADGRDAEMRYRALRTSKDFLTSHVLTWIVAYAIQGNRKGYARILCRVCAKSQRWLPMLNRRAARFADWPHWQVGGFDGRPQVCTGI